MLNNTFIVIRFYVICISLKEILLDLQDLKLQFIPFGFDYK